MKKSVLFRAALFSLILCLLLPLVLPFAASAASGSATIGLSSTTVYVGNYVYVTVTYSASVPMATWSFGVTYDTSRLKYISGAQSTAGGTLNFVDQPTSGGVSSKSYTITFQTIALGEATVSTVTREVYAQDYSSISVSNASRTISIVEKPAASGENRLSALSAEGATLSPAFDRDTQQYKVSVPYSVNKLTFNASTVHSAASVYVQGADDLSVGENEVRITVTAENSATRTYTVTVTRKDSDYQGASVTLDNREYTFVRDPSEVKKLPKGFSAIDGTYQKKNVLLFANESESAKLAVLSEAETGKQHLFLYGEKEERFFPYLSSETPAKQYIFLTPDQEVEIPEGFHKTSLVVSDTEISAWENKPEKGEEKITLVYATPLDGEAAFYVYHTENKAFVLYHETPPTLSSDGKTMEEMEAALLTQQENYAILEQNVRTAFFVALCVGGFLLLLIVILCIVAAVRGRRCKKLLAARRDEVVQSEPVFVSEHLPTVPLTPESDEPAPVPTPEEPMAETTVSPVQAEPPRAASTSAERLIPIWEELAATPAEKPKREPSSHRGHAAVESVFGQMNDDEEFRKNNPVIDEDEEDGGDAPVYGFEED